MSSSAASRPAVVVVGGGFAGFYAAKALERLLPASAADLTMISATDHLCYSPLLPEVAAGRLGPRRIAVPLHAALRRTRVMQAVVDDVNFDERKLTFTTGDGVVQHASWDRLALTTGSVTRTLETPGLATHALGLKNLIEADYVHDHVLRQLELADSTTDPAATCPTDIRRGRRGVCRDRDGSPVAVDDPSAAFAFPAPRAPGAAVGSS